MGKLNSLALLLCGIIILGCSTVNISSKRLSEVQQSDKEGLLLVSIGRAGHSLQLTGVLPFVDYYIYRVKDNEVVNMGFLKSEVVQLSHVGGHLGQGKYGVIHMINLPTGEYYLVGSRRGTSAGYIYPGGGGAIYLPGKATRIIFKINIKPGRINYVGELLLVGKDLENPQSIKVSNQLERDFAFAQKSTPELSKEDVIVNIAVRD